jgi:predicted unusual protein kinase regulating ubiquinone biosynthesis (AarF/ABC1/UbiB family)
VPGVYTELSTARLLVMEEVQGIPIPDAPEGDSRKEAARQLLESYYQQVLGEGFFHADPHPGNLMWWRDQIYFLDFGMIGEVTPEVREQLLLVLMAFWQEDAAFLAEIMVNLAGDEYPPDLNMDALQAELADLVSEYRHLSLQELRLGPLLQRMTQISIRHNVRLPASLALAGKAFGQMQLATAQLDPTLDPFTVAGAFYFRRVREGVRQWANPRALLYEAQKLRLRVTRLAEALEGLTGARPGRRLQIDIGGYSDIEQTIRRAGRRVALALTAGAAIIAFGVTATSGAAGWLSAGFGILAGLLAVAVLIDVARGRS